MTVTSISRQRAALGGADVVIDTVGGDMLAQRLGELADRGRLVFIVDTPKPQDLLAA
ncbi:MULTISPECIES: hypothetical protein [Pseudonocardia]|uniref:hypothetical protein n=1 Tax=Pseudonocardia TaxID=1847 RepID=UPI001AD61599|nr:MULTISPECIES: hypothetical protein [Pseudonocardia]